MPPEPAVSYDEDLYERARTQWQFGDWDSLARISPDAIQHHPERARIALMVASGLIQCNKVEEGGKFIALAKAWGCGRKLIAQILVAGVHDSIARAALVANQEQRALQHFEKAVSTGSPGADQRLLGQARINQQGAQLGSALKALAVTENARLQTEQFRLYDWSPAAHVKPADCHASAFLYYRQLGTPDPGHSPVSFFLIDSKSLPRSGLHYLKRTLQRVLEESFSFCEWYQEAGCCRKMPCANTSYAEYAKAKGVLRVRLLKSHDFQLKDPVYPATGVSRRLVLVRDPAYQLTSWFALDELSRHKQHLAAAGIKMEKIWLAHEPEVLQQAYSILDAKFQRLPKADLEAWLQQKSRYVEDFMRKWIPTAREQASGKVDVVDYDEINKYISALVAEVKGYATPQACERIDAYIKSGSNRFESRGSPWRVDSVLLTEYFAEHESSFQMYVEKVLAARRELLNA